MAYYSKEEMVQWYNRLPRIPIGVKAILTNESGEVLISKPNYRPGWQLIGGTVDENESPLAAIGREIHEETGLTIDASRLTFRGAGYTSPRSGVPGVLVLIFGVVLKAEEVKDIVIQKEEIENFKFVAPKDLPDDHVNHLLSETVAFRDAGVSGGYVEDGKLEVKI